MIEYLRVAENHQRDWHNYDYVNRESWLAWPWPEPAREPMRQQVIRLFARVAVLVASLLPGWQPDRAT